MKNKNTMLLIGIGVAYLLYRMYAKKTLAPVITNTSATPSVLYPDDHNAVTSQTPNPYLVDTINTAELVDIPATYQTYYGRLTGTNSKTPYTC